MMMIVYNSPEDYLNELVERYSDDPMSPKTLDRIAYTASRCPEQFLERYEKRCVYHDLPQWANIFYQERIKRVDLSELSEIP